MGRFSSTATITGERAGAGIKREGKNRTPWKGKAPKWGMAKD